MAKLDKQGLNTFIRELDKHINTKINRLDISPTAEKVIMANGSNVEEAITNLQTELNGQRLRGIEISNSILELIGGGE